MKLDPCHVDMRVSICLRGFRTPGSNLAVFDRGMSSSSKASADADRRQAVPRGQSPARAANLAINFTSADKTEISGTLGCTRSGARG